MSGELILVVDDEATIVEVVELYLQREGFRVVTAATGPAAIAAMSAERPDLVVLDLMLPGIGGLEITKQVRTAGNLPIIMLTARGSETDRVVGLELGADDYVTKPFSPRELVARIKAVLRRTQAGSEPDDAQVLVIGGLRLDAKSHMVTLDSQQLSLTLREFELLAFLMRNPGQVFTREQLLDNVWGYEFASELSTVTVHVRRLREKIERDPTNPTVLQTVWGVGYRLHKA
ncbi:MAG: response regulator transcription factor [Roseiflexaceae bacterium]|nr:response regulator transcription factor [Roseiflexaceae bacterium]